MDAAIKHCTSGIGIWEWASNDMGSEPDVVMACAGDVPTLEMVDRRFVTNWSSTDSTSPNMVRICLKSANGNGRIDSLQHSSGPLDTSLCGVTDLAGALRHGMQRGVLPDPRSRALAWECNPAFRSAGVMSIAPLQPNGRWGRESEGAVPPAISPATGPTGWQTPGGRPG